VANSEIADKPSPLGSGQRQSVKAAPAQMSFPTFTQIQCSVDQPSDRQFKGELVSATKTERAMQIGQ
jgi:hypothetical protein